MQRVLLLLVTVFTLYACASNVPHTADDKPPVPAVPVGEQSTAPETDVNTVPPTTPIGEGATAPLVHADIMSEPLPPSGGDGAPHIALLLPLKSPIFGPVAEAVRQGFLAAASVQTGGLPLRIYDSLDENQDIISLYRQAIANGARAVVGPLTRNGVNTLATQHNIPVPTLCLNVADNPDGQQLYFFGMEVEAEARQVARLARQQGLHQAIIITTPAQLSKRLQFAFEETWHHSGGTLLREIEFNGDFNELSSIVEEPGTVVFLAADAEKARLIRPYLPNKLPIYATSQTFIGNDKTLTNYDLNNIRFVDMPWLLQPDHAAVMTYPHAFPPLSADLERFYAMGIDSFRLIQLMLFQRVNSALPLDGVTGQIILSGHTFKRLGIPAVLNQGQAQLSNTSAAPVPTFPDKMMNTP